MGLGGRDEFFHEQQREVERRARAAAGEETTIAHGAFMGEDRGQFRRDGEVRRVTSAGEQARIVEHGGRGADGGEPATVGVLAEDERADARIGAQKRDTRPAGQKDAVEGAITDGGERGVGAEREAAAAGDEQVFGQRCDHDLDAGAAQEVDRSDGFNFLKTGGEDCQNVGHGVRLEGMSDPAHGNVLAGKRLVIFGCGYIGRAVAHAALSAGMNVTALTRNTDKAAALRAEGVRDVVLGDLASATWHADIPGGPDVVLNCVSSGGGGLEGYRHSYRDGMASLVAWLRAQGGAGTVIYTSSTSVYPQDGGARVDETAPTGGDERAATLLAAEHRLLHATDAAATRVVLRLAGIYGPGRHHLLEQVRAGAAAGRGEAHLNLAYRDDIVAAVLAVSALAPGAHVFNVADDGAATKGEMVAWLAARLGLPVPAFTGVPAGGRRAVTPDRIILNTALKAATGWRPACPTFREGYEKILSL